MISSNQNERVKYWSSLKEKKNRDEYKEYIIEGEHLVLEAYKNGYLKTVIYFDKLNSDFKGVEVVEVSDNVMKKISSTQTPQKVAGIARYFDEVTYSNEEGIIALDGVQDPGNAGTIVRNSLAFGYNLVFFSNESVDIYNSKFIRATQGYFYSLKIIRGNIKDFILNLKENNYQIVSTYLDKESINLNEFKVNPKHCLVLGNEGQGVSKEIIDLSDKKIIIPMDDKVDSLNVAVASGILMYKFKN